MRTTQKAGSSSVSTESNTKKRDEVLDLQAIALLFLTDTHTQEASAQDGGYKK